MGAGSGSKALQASHILLDRLLPGETVSSHGSLWCTFRVDAPVDGIHVKSGWSVCEGDVLIKDLALRAGVIGAVLILIVGRAARRIF